MRRRVCFDFDDLKMAATDTAWFAVIIKQNGRLLSKELLEIKFTDTIGDVVSNVDPNMEAVKASAGPTVDDQMCVNMSCPVQTIHSFGAKFIVLDSVLQDRRSNNTNTSERNVFSEMMKNSKIENKLPPKKKAESGRVKMRIFNDVRYALEERNIGFLTEQVESLGSRVLDTLVNALALVDSQHQLLRDRGVHHLAPMFSKIHSYIDYKKSHLLRPKVVSTEIVNCLI